jgi:paraquat-inducible protein B
MDIHPDAPSCKIVYGERCPEFPTLPTPMEEVTKDVTRIIDKLSKLPLDQIVKDLRDAMHHLSRTAEHLETLIQNFDKEVAPAASATLEKAQKTLTKMDRLLNADSPMGHEMKRALGELADAARNISIMADYLERHPEALIRGKGKTQ